MSKLSSDDDRTKIYVVIDSWGEYSDAGQMVAGVYSTQEKADAVVATVVARHTGQTVPSCLLSEVEEHEVDE